MRLALVLLVAIVCVACRSDSQKAKPRSTKPLLAKRENHEALWGKKEEKEAYAYVYKDDDTSLADLLHRYPQLVAALNKDRNSLLIEAGYLGASHSAEALLRSGANPNRTGFNGITPLVAAAANKEFGKALAVSRVLVEHGANVSQKSVLDETPIIFAARSGNVELIRYLVTKGADVNYSTAAGAHVSRSIYKGVKTALGEAALLGQGDAITCLLSLGANVDIACDKDGSTPLVNAAIGMHPHSMKILIDHGANVNARDGRNLTPIYSAVLSGNLEVVKVLVEHGAEINGENLSPYIKTTEIAEYLRSQGSK